MFFNVSLNALTSCFVPDRNLLAVALRTAAVVAKEDAEVFEDGWMGDWQSAISATRDLIDGWEGEGLCLHNSKSSSCSWNAALGLNNGRAKKMI